LCSLGFTGADTGDVPHFCDDGQSLVCVGFIDKETINSKIVEIDGVVFPALR